MTGERVCFSGAVKSEVMCQHLGLYEASLILVTQVKGQLLEEYSMSLPLWLPCGRVRNEKGSEDK